MSLAPCRFSGGRVESQGIHLLISQRGNVYHAWGSHLHQANDKPLPSVAPTPLRRLDHTIHSLSCLGDADRPHQKQVRACGRKRPPASTIDHPASTGETACLYQDGPDAPGPAGKNGTDLETSPRHRSARDAAAVASPGLQTLWEIQVQSNFCHTKDLHRDGGLDQGDGKGQSPVGSRTDPWRTPQAGSSCLQAHHSEVHEAGPYHKATRTDVDHVLTHACPADLGLRLPACHGSPLPFALRLLHCRTALAPSDPRRRDTIAHRRLDRTYLFGKPLPMVWSRSTSSVIMTPSLGWASLG
jgi:hypothetical protein